MIAKRLDGNSTVDALAVNRGGEPDDLAPMVAVPFIAGKFNFRTFHRTT
jgi:hypothetical protein